MQDIVVETDGIVETLDVAMTPEMPLRGKRDCTSSGAGMKRLQMAHCLRGMRRSINTQYHAPLERFPSKSLVTLLQGLNENKIHVVMCA